MFSKVHSIYFSEHFPHQLVQAFLEPAMFQPWNSKGEDLIGGYGVNFSSLTIRIGGAGLMKSSKSRKGSLRVPQLGGGGASIMQVP